jgi:hypothetical protein
MKKQKENKKRESII